MDGGRGCSAGRRAGGANDKTIINRIMLRFRPIAPKPAAGGSGSDESPPEKKSDLVTKRRAKRKYVRAKKNIRCKTNKAEKPKEGFDRTISTLQLLPEFAGEEETKASGSNSDIIPPAIQTVQQQPIWLNFNSKPESSTGIAFSALDQSDLTAVTPATRVAESWVTVECVTDVCMDGGGGGGFGSTDVERIKNLETDTCPAFISDGANRVQWTNLAYKRMVLAEDQVGETTPPQTVVRLEVKVELPVSYPVFACRVRVQYTWRKEKYSQTMPCDVWKMDFGGFAWRLDVKAALSLGR